MEFLVSGLQKSYNFESVQSGDIFHVLNLWKGYCTRMGIELSGETVIIKVNQEGFPKSFKVRQLAHTFTQTREGLSNGASDMKSYNVELRAVFSKVPYAIIISYSSAYYPEGKYWHSMGPQILITREGSI